MEQLIDMNSNDLLTVGASPSIWDIENAEKLQFSTFIQEKMDTRFNQRFDYYEQMLLSLKEEHAKQLLKMQTELDETRQHVCHLQDKLTSHHNFVLIGWHSQRPIVVPAEFTLLTFDSYINSYHSTDTSQVIKLILSKLYETPIRHLDLLNLMVIDNSHGRARLIVLVDDELKTILGHQNGNGTREKEYYFRRHIQTIKTIEQQYPGLFDYPEHLKRELLL